MTTTAPLLNIAGLSLGFGAPHKGVRTVVNDFSLRLERGQILALVGESGSGKTLVARAILNLLPPACRVMGGRIEFDGSDVLTMRSPELRKLRGARIGMVFQEPMVSLNPALTIGFQLAEGMRLHTQLSDEAIRKASVDMLSRVRIGDPESCLKLFPHQFSGGMRQRIMLASAMLLRPDLLLADEPTSALDSIVQKEVLDIMFEVTRTFGTSVILITHDLALAAQYADTVAVMCRGDLKEVGSADEILRRPRHEYTRALLESLPERQPEKSREHRQGAPLVEVRDVLVEFPRKRAWPWERRRSTRAVNAVGLTVYRGETLALVGESGSGKTTLGRALVRDVSVASGTIRYDGQDITEAGNAELRPLRSRIQFVFQDPYSSLDPRLRVATIVAQGLRRVPGMQQSARDEKVARMLSDVGLSADYAQRFPHELSGGQRQRVCIARALAMNPEFVVADEPVAALDVTVQAQVLQLFAQLKEQYGFTALFISHDLAVVEQVADRVAVMYLGQIVEQGPTPAIMGSPYHPYTRQLMTLRPRLSKTANGEYLLHPRAAPEMRAPDGSRFAIPISGDTSERHSRLIEVGPGHSVLCES